MRIHVRTCQARYREQEHGQHEHREPDDRDHGPRANRDDANLRLRLRGHQRTCSWPSRRFLAQSDRRRLDSAHACGAARARDRARARRLLGRHPLALPRHPRPVRRRRHDGRLGPDVVQPRAGAPRHSGGVPRPPPAETGLRRRRRDLRGRLARAGSHPRSRCSWVRAASRLRVARSSSWLRSISSRRRPGATRAPRTCGSSPESSGRRSARRPAGSSRRRSAGSRSSSRRCRSRWRRSSRFAESRCAGSAPAGRPRWMPNAALLLLSGGLVAALFLIVLLLVDGWGMSPAAAGVVVTVMPLVAIAAARLARIRRPGSGCASRPASSSSRAGSRASRYPRAGWWWTLPPPLLVGTGLGTSLAALTERAVAGRASRWCTAAGRLPRHAGVVLGSSCSRRSSRGRSTEPGRGGARGRGGPRQPIPPLDKLRSRRTCSWRWTGEGDGEVPRIAAAFEDRPDGRGVPLTLPRSGSARPGGHGCVLGPVPPRGRSRARRARTARAQPREEPL